MNYFKAIEVNKSSGNINNVYGWFGNCHQDEQPIKFIKEIQGFLISRLPGIFILTGEDVYGEDSFGDKFQEDLERAAHTTANVFYDSHNSFEERW